MRYQQLIYIQNEHAGVRNKDILNVNMSSDMYVFEAPSFSISGASKINCSGSTGTTYVITGDTTIPVSFNFTGNVSTFSATNATFSYGVYKYNDTLGGFTLPAVYFSQNFEYPTFSGTNIINDLIPISSLALDGQYLIKGYFSFNTPTTFLSSLSKTIDTSNYISGSEYSIYDKDLDYYFIAFKEADKPILLQNGSNNPPANQLFQQVIIAEPGNSNIVISQNYAGNFVLTLNGLVLAPNYDYTFTGNLVTLTSSPLSEDIITVIYTTSGGNNLMGDNIEVTSPIVSGATNLNGSNNPYFNTTSQKYEIYTTVEPSNIGDILVMLNGATLANGIDFYRSTTNPKRIILEGDLLVGDMITIVYFPIISTVNGIITSNPIISWQIDTPPQTADGVFTLEVSTATTFNTLYHSSSQNYVIGQTIYSDSFSVSGTVGTNLYYRVKNEKQFKTLCNQTLSNITYTDTIPTQILTNAINAY